MRFFRFDPFEHLDREELTVGGLRARAAANQVDTTPVSHPGSKPVEEGETRQVTSGDMMRMFAAHQEQLADQQAD